MSTDAKSDSEPEPESVHEVADKSTPEPESKDSAPDSEADSNPWQAIWSPQYNAYYFYNATTDVTTWSNPLEPASEQQESPAESSAQAAAAAPAESAPAPAVAEATADPTLLAYKAAEQAALAQGIDPSLAYLDPTLGQAGSIPGVPGVPPSFQAKFNARTGRFTAIDGRDPTHMSEFERAKRMSEFYFDTDAWSRDIDERYHQGEAAETEEVGQKRKRPSKKDLVSVVPFTSHFCCPNPSI